MSCSRAPDSSTVQPRPLSGIEKEQLYRCFEVRPLADVWKYTNSTIEKLRAVDGDCFSSVLGTC